MNAPIIYIPNFIVNADEALASLQNDLDWERRDTTPRCEYYCNDFNKPYVYGTGKGQREYLPKPYHQVITDIRNKIQEVSKTEFEVCFLNRYLNQSDQLGWHADDSPEMDDDRPIAIVSLGVEREIWFRPIIGTQCGSCSGAVETEDLVASDLYGTAHKMSCYVHEKRRPLYGDIEKVKLEHGSLCLMQPHMQETWQHRIPKASFLCGERVSLTYRGYLND